MTVQFDLFGSPEEGILESPDYPTFRERLRTSECRKCPLWEGRTTIVVDRGSPAAGLMAVGEAPGEKEDLQGRAFVGRAGKVLDRLLVKVGIDTERQIIIANVVKCRPPGNRAPLREEAEACLPYLRRQVELVRPHTVLLLGATAVRHLVRGRGSLAMKDRAGKPFTSPEYPGIEFVPLYHPAYILRDPRREQDFLSHLGELRERLLPAGRWPG